MTPPPQKKKKKKEKKQLDFSVNPKNIKSFSSLILFYLLKVTKFRPCPLLWETLPPPLFLQERGLSLQPNFQKGGFDRTSALEGGCWERWSDFFQWGGCNFHIKNKLKSEIFNDKKSL